MHILKRGYVPYHLERLSCRPINQGGRERVRAFIQLSEEALKIELGEMVRKSVEDTLNTLFDEYENVIP